MSTQEKTKIAVVRARWHSEIVDKAVNSFTKTWANLADETAPVEVFDVPGAFEIPLMAKSLAKKGYSAVVGVAFVVDGGIYRHDFVATAVVGGLMQVQLETDMPVLSVVLTPHNFQESEAHINFFKEHFLLKGAEAAKACGQILQAHAL